MKTLKSLSFFGLALMLLLTSCSTMDKRLYMSGYHVEWKKNKHNSNSQALANGNVEKKSVQHETNVVEQPIKEISIIENAKVVSDNSITASLDNSFVPAVEKPVSIQKTESNSLSSSDEIGNTIAFDTKEVKNKPAFSEKKNDRGSFLTSMSSAKKAGAGLYILAFFIPFLAVGIHTGWKKPTFYCFLWSLLGWLPGIIHAFIQLGK